MAQRREQFPYYNFRTKKSAREKVSDLLLAVKERSEELRKIEGQLLKLDEKRDKLNKQLDDYKKDPKSYDVRQIWKLRDSIEELDNKIGARRNIIRDNSRDIDRAIKIREKIKEKFGLGYLDPITGKERSDIIRGPISEELRQTLLGNPLTEEEKYQIYGRQPDLNEIYRERQYLENAVRRRPRNQSIQNRLRNLIEKTQGLIGGTVDLDELITDELYSDEGGAVGPYDIKIPESYSKPVLKAKELVEYRPGDNRIFGSYAYRKQQFPGDIDTMQIIEYSKSEKEIIKIFKKKLQYIVKRINKSRGDYFSEAKIGLDEVFLDAIYLGDWRNGVLYNYDPDQIILELELLEKQKYLNKKQTDDFIKLVKQNITHDEWDKLFEELRKYLILRWDDKEILKGYKIIAPNRKITLSDALSHKTMVKIDIFAPVNNRYVEVTNFFIIIELDSAGNHILLNLPHDYLQTFDENIKRELEKLLYSSVYYKPFKAAKRIFSLARSSRDKIVLNKIDPIISSDASLLSQINSEIEVIILMLERLKTLPIATMLKQIDEFKSRLAYITEIQFDEEEIDEIFDNIVKNKKLKREKVIDELKYVKKYFQEKINDFTINYLEKVGLVPPPRNYLPKQLKY